MFCFYSFFRSQLEMEFRGRPAKASRSDSGGRRKGLNNFGEYYAPGKGSHDQMTPTSRFIQKV